MSSIKTNMALSGTKAKSRGVLNTTIDGEVLDEFKAVCKSQGIAMNTLIESFMSGYNKGNFVLTIGKGKPELEIEE